jgi:energy-coupling factor transport system permease protein
MLVGRACRAALAAGLMALPFWIFLGVIHGLFRDDPAAALAVAGPNTANIAAFALAQAVVEPAQLVDALLARRVPFAVVQLLVAALQAVPRLRARARAIIEAQRCRGLGIGGGPWSRGPALVPLFLPLVFGSLSEVDERAMALEARGAGAGRPRTPLHPPVDSAADRVTRVLLFVAVVSILSYRWLV